MSELQGKQMYAYLSLRNLNFTQICNWGFTQTFLHAGKKVCNEKSKETKRKTKNDGHFL